MDVQEFPVLAAADRSLVDRFAVGLDDDGARVLAYLQRRLEDDEFSKTATETAILVGTSVNKSAAKRALDELTAAAVIEETTVRTTEPGRPPKAWHVASRRDATARRLYEHHAKRLLEQSERFEERFPSEQSTGTTGIDSVGSDTADTDGVNNDNANASGLDAGAGDNGGASNATVNPETNQTGKRDRIVIGLNWRPNGLHLPLFAARTSSNADFEPPVELAFEEYAGSRRVIDGVRAGESDVGIAGAATVARERARGESIVPIAVLFQRSTVVLFTTRERFGEPFDSLERLRGRRVGMPTDTETGLLGRLLLEQAGLRDDVELVDVEGEERNALESGSVDAVTGMGPDPRRFESSTRTVETLAMSDQFPVYGPVVVANESTLESRATAVETLLSRIVSGWAKATEEPKPAAAEIAAESDESADRIVRTFEHAREAFGSSDAVRKHGWGWHSPKAWANLRAALAQGGAFDDSAGRSRDGVGDDD